MRAKLLVVMLVLVTSSLFAQSPAAPINSKAGDVFVGYTWTRTDYGTITMNGATGSVAFPLTTRISAVAQGSAGFASRDFRAYSFTAGPRYTFSDRSVQPFVQVLVGYSAMGFVPRPSGFALQGGGGVDWNVRSRFGLRLIQAEYENQFNYMRSHSSTRLRLSTGLKWRF